MADVSHFDPDGVIHERGRHGEPFNAEPSIRKLTSCPITEQRDLYRRNHDDIVYAEPDVKATDDWALDIVVDKDVAQELGWQQWLPAATGTTNASTSTTSHADHADPTSAAAANSSNADVSPSSRTLSLPLSTLKSTYPTRHVLSAMECAGNRRSEMNARTNKPASPEGLQWKQGAIGNAKWQGATLREVLLSLGVPDPYSHLDEKDGLEPTLEVMETRSAPWSRRTYVHFLSSQPSSEADATATSPAAQVYGSSLPLSVALHPNQGVLLCYSVNNAHLGPAHGYPLRVVIPGFVAARWVKWLRGLRITARENDSPPMRDDYKILAPPEGSSGEEERKWVEGLSGEKADPEKRMKALHDLPPLMTLGVGSGISEPQEDESGSEVVVNVDEGGKWMAKGYAVGTEGSPVTLVELLLLPQDAAADSPSSSLESLRETACQTPDSQWIRLQLDPPRHVSASDDGAASRFSWSWSLWDAHLDAPPPDSAGATQWALVVRCTTSAGVRQEMQSPWNVRGFRERSWPVVRGLVFHQRRGL